MNDYGVRQKKSRAPGYELLNKGVKSPGGVSKMPRRKEGGDGERRKPSSWVKGDRHQDPWGGLGRWVSGDRSIRKASSWMQVKILGSKGRELVREPTHRLDRRGLKRS